MASPQIYNSAVAVLLFSSLSVENAVRSRDSKFFCLFAVNCQNSSTPGRDIYDEFIESFYIVSDYSYVQLC